MTIPELNEYAVKYRGTVLNSLIKIERLMDIYLCQYFTDVDHKINELLNMVFGTLRLTFENKRSILDYLIKKELVDIYKDRPNLAKELQELNSKRTILAHYLLDLSPEAQELTKGTVRFYKFMNYQDYETIGAAEFLSLELSLFDIYDYMVKKTSGALPPSDSATVHSSEPS